jgi:sRNA-binding protein
MATDEIAKDKQARYEAAFTVLNMLAETWPACFKHDDETPVPLAIGTYHRVQAELGEMVDEEGSVQYTCNLFQARIFRRKEPLKTTI